MKTFTRILSLLGIVILTQTAVFSQTNYNHYQTVNQVQIDFSDPVNCPYANSDAVGEWSFIKLTNLSAADKTVSYKIDLYYQGEGCVNCDNNTYVITLTVPANSSLTVDCDITNPDHRKLGVFRKFVNQTNARVFDHFELSGLTVQ